MSRRVRKNLFTSTLILVIAFIAIFVYLGAGTLLRAQESETGNVAEEPESADSPILVVRVVEREELTDQRDGHTRVFKVIEEVEIRTDNDPDVKPYVHDLKITWKEIPLPGDFAYTIQILRKALSERLKILKELHS